MSLVLSGVALLVALIGVAANQLVSLFPRLGIGLLHRVGAVQAACAAVALSLAAASVWLFPRSDVALGIAIVATALVALSPWLLNPRMALLALTHPPRAAAEEARLDGDEAVLGLVIGEVACAWPLRVLVPHHVVNDGLAGTNLVVTWCASCRSGAVYAAEVAGKALTFEVAGIYRGNLVMRDRQTRSLWQQATAEAVAGALRGERLRLLEAERCTWGAWREAHPETQVSRDPGRLRLLGPRAVAWMLQAITSRYTTPGLHARDYRIPLKREVVGLSLDGADRAYPLGVLSRGGRVEDALGQRRVELTYDVTMDRVTARDLGSGAVLPSWRGWWYGWYEFHPETSVYR